MTTQQLIESETVSTYVHEIISGNYHEITGNDSKSSSARTLFNIYAGRRDHIDNINIDITSFAEATCASIRKRTEERGVSTRVRWQCCNGGVPSQRDENSTQKKTSA